MAENGYRQRVAKYVEEAKRRLKKSEAKRKKKSGPEYAIPGFDVPVGQPRPVAQRRRPVQAPSTPEASVPKRRKEPLSESIKQRMNARTRLSTRRY